MITQIGSLKECIAVIKDIDIGSFENMINHTDEARERVIKAAEWAMQNGYMED